MRSGQYKLSCSKGSIEEGKEISVGHFRTSCKELPPLSAVLQNGQLPSDFTSFHLASFKREEGRNERKDTMLRNCKEQLFKGEKRREGIIRHRSCENVSFLPRGAVNRVEQKVRSLLLRGESKRRAENVYNNNSSDLFEGNSRSDLWQAGKIVIMPRKHRLTGAHSHSALHTLSTSSDSASCLSASSGYSSSSSSSYGSFKSSVSVTSTLPRHRNTSPGSQSPTSDTNRILFVDNPLYDITPAAVSRFNDISRTHGDTSGMESMSSGEYSLGEGYTPLPDPFEDPVAKECKEYFEKRLRSSETLKKKWSLYMSQPTASERDENIDSELISKGDAIIDSKFNASFGSEMSFAVESNFIPPEELSGTPPKSKTETKTQLDVKMEFLRKEIASLIQQDNTLFKQLLALHDSISTLKVQNALGQHAHALRPLTPSDLDSFTEEEEEDEEEEEEEEEEEGNDNKKEDRRDEVESEEKTEESHSDTEEKTFSLHEGGMGSEESKKDIEDDEDEGHCTDLSLGHTPSHSPSPASTLSSNSSKDSSYSRSLYSEMASDFSGSFTRCRKSYAPNARNRRRASSVHRQKAPHLDCGTTMALVVVHADDEDVLLNSNRPRAHSFTPLTVFASHAALAYSQSNDTNKALSHNTAPEANLFVSPSSKMQQKTKEKSQNENKKIPSKMPLGSCSSQTVTSLPLCGPSLPNLAHPPYREALIM